MRSMLASYWIKFDPVDRFTVVFCWLLTIRLGFDYSFYTNDLTADLKFAEVLLTGLLILLPIAPLLGRLRSAGLAACCALYFAFFKIWLAQVNSPNPIFQQWSQVLPFWILLVLSLKPILGQVRAGFLIKALIALAFFGSGVSKLRNEEFWANGYTLRHYLVARAQILDLPATLSLASHFTLLKFASWVVLLAELLAPLALLHRRLTYIFLGYALTFHGLAHYFMGVYWWRYFGLAYLIFLFVPHDQRLRRLTDTGR